MSNRIARRRFLQIAGGASALATLGPTSAAGAATHRATTTARLSYTTTWTGNTFGYGDGKLVQDFIWAIAVSGDGRVYTISFYSVGDRHQPSLSRVFGERGGIGAGRPGVVAPRKLFGITGSAPTLPESSTWA